MKPDQLRALPSVDALLQDHTVRALEQTYGHAIVVAATRDALAAARKTIHAGGDALTPQGGFALPALLDDVRTRVERAVQPSLVPVINATGVIIHTNLGRAPLSEETINAMRAAAIGYSNLEYDLVQGARGSRHAHAEEILQRLTGAQAALVVNNNAAAVMLILAAFARKKEVVISRGQLVEIGGGFRVPDVMKQSGAKLVEVGTTNRTRREDYAAAVTDKTALLLRVHRSNFRIVGFTEDATLEELVALGRARGVMVADDLGSGALLDTATYGLAHEPMPQESLQAGVALVSFSGDKLLGGPQAGIILGQKEEIERLKRFPLTRALRVDKVTLAGLQATLLHYMKEEAPRKVPVWAMIAASRDQLDRRAQKWADRLRARGLDASVMDSQSTVGGGSLPGETLPTRALAIKVAGVDKIAARLRENDPPIVARIEGNRLMFDPRTVLEAEEETLLAGIELCAKQRDNGG
jgi:L-seryl-tRNA(Ser) seleniumtransferase